MKIPILDHWLKSAQALLEEVRGQSLDRLERQKLAVKLAGFLLLGSRKERNWREKIKDFILNKFLSNHRYRKLAIALSDQSFRSQDKKRTKDQMRYLLGRSIPFLIPLLRVAMRTVILPGEQKALMKALRKREARGVKVNLNRLGEAILSENEALSRVNLYCQDLAATEDYSISIKISTLYSQINQIAWEDNLKALSSRLRLLYREAMRHQPHKMVNLDMEAYRDLPLTVELFQRVLSEPQFQLLSAGIVLQAYIPESFAYQQKLTRWAEERVKFGGAPIKLRIVKGANLKVEQVEAASHGWPQAPYTCKADVDANFKRMVEYALEPQRALAVRVGIASHNLFDIAYALILRAERQVEDLSLFEMLEGMASAQQRTLQKLTGSLLLYCPASRKGEFPYAMAYLIRRLDENTAPENFLRHIAQFKPASKLWEEEALRFSSACQKIEGLSEAPRDAQDRREPPQDLPPKAPFAHEPSTNYSLPQNRRWAGEVDLPSFEKPRLLSWKEVDQALEEAQGAPFPAVAPLFRRHRSELIGLMIAEGKKVFIEADLEVDEAIDFLEYYPRSVAALKEDKEVSWRPLGRIVVASPWNFPLAIPVGGITAALATGNAVLFKPAPEVLSIGRKIVELFWEAGVPKTALHFIPCEEEPTGNTLICDQRVDGVILTGATATARHFLKLRPHLPLFAETGGKNSIIISNMADKEQAISHLISSAFGHSGQKCSACSLAILHKEFYDDPKFLLTLKEAVASLPVGLPTDLSTKIGPLIKPPEGALLRALTILETGEEWLLKSQPLAADLWSPGIKLCQQIDPIERFGPILAILRAENLDHAIALANSTPYGLTAGLESLDKREIQKWCQKILAGNLYVNRPITGAICGRQPFGGCKASSFGPGAKAGGPHYVAQFMIPTQVQLPRLSGSHPVEALLSEEEILPFRHSLGSYRSHWDRLKAPTELAHLLGETNVFYLVPRDHVTILANDSRLDIARALSAAEICGTKVSLEGADPYPWNAFFRLHTTSCPTHLCPLPCLASGQYELLRYAQEVSLSITTHRYGNVEI